jgi:hypothetical protein
MQSVRELGIVNRCSALVQEIKIIARREHIAVMK